MKLSKREIALIVAALVIGLSFLVINFVIAPMFRDYSAAQDIYSDFLERKEQFESKFADEPQIRQDYNEASEAFAKISKQYPTNIPNEEVDRILTELCMMTNLTSDSLSIGLPVPITFSFTPGEGEAPETPPDPAFQVVTATMKLKGSYVSFKNLLDTVQNTTYIRVSKFSISAAGGELYDTVTIDVSFEISMIAKTQS